MLSLRENQKETLQTVEKQDKHEKTLIVGVLQERE